MKEYDCYLFDADGTLFDTAELIYQCFLYTCKTFGGFEPSRQAIFSKIGLPLRDQLVLYLGDQALTNYEAIRSAHMKYQMSIYSRHLRLIPSIATMLETLKIHTKILGVVTSRMKDTLSLFLKETGILSCFDVLVTPEDTSRHKPNPDPVLCALQKLNAKKRNTLFAGDATFDIECGNSAGVDTAFVTWSMNSPELLTVKPTYYITDPMDLCKFTDTKTKESR